MDNDKAALLRMLESMEIEVVTIDRETEVVKQGDPPMEPNAWREHRPTGVVTVTLTGRLT